jgi:hypothetical protein
VNGISGGTLFSIKCIVQDSPFAVILFLLVSTICIGGFAIRVYERTQDIDADNFSSYDNSIWLVILTLTTVGYGDSDPSTNFGRVVGVLVCLWGMIIVAMIVNTVSSALVLDTA